MIMKKFAKFIQPTLEEFQKDMNASYVVVNLKQNKQPITMLDIEYALI